MTRLNDKITAMSQGARLACGAALLAIGVAGGASAASLHRPGIEMAPTIVTPIAKLAASSGIVTIRGRIDEIYGDRAVISDGSAKTMVDVGRHAATGLAVGNTILVQGHYDDGQLHASFLVGPNGQVEAVGPGPRGPRPGPHDGPDPRDPKAGPPPAPPAAPACVAPPAPAAAPSAAPGAASK